ncbi:hypothetical protein BWI17_06875 [Betaproteobacteria bacterium GR16-43]|nr:hypothetical protein BWI17_06875 [Betaproteobacteria bacterium GR16-43]
MRDYPDIKSPRTLARIGGALYLAIILLGIFCEMYVRGSIVVAGDAAATAANLRSMETLWRAGIAAELVLLVCAIPLTWILFLLLRPVQRDLALLALLFSVVTLSVEATTALDLLAALSPLGKAAYLGAFEPAQLHALAGLALKAHSHSFGVTLVFFGVECVIVGHLIFRSGFLPRTIGVLMQVAGASYLVNSFAIVLAPTLADVTFAAMVVPVLAGEGSLCLWLLLKGVDEARWLRLDKAA